MSLVPAETTRIRPFPEISRLRSMVMTPESGWNWAPAVLPLVLARMFFLKHGPHDFGDLLRGLSLGKDDFGKTLAEGAVMIDLGKAEILKRQVPEPVQGRAGREFPALDGFQNFQYVRLIHAIQPLEILSSARGMASP
jgi:hypothetical protein